MGTEDQDAPLCHPAPHHLFLLHPCLLLPPLLQHWQLQPGPCPWRSNFGRAGWTVSWRCLWRREGKAWGEGKTFLWIRLSALLLPLYALFCLGCFVLPLMDVQRFKLL